MKSRDDLTPSGANLRADSVALSSCAIPLANVGFLDGSQRPEMARIGPSLMRGHARLRLNGNQSKSIIMSRGGKREGAGRKPGSPNKATAEIRDLARSYSSSALNELHRLATSAKSETARIAAIREILDRGYGRPQTALGDEFGQQPVQFTIIRSGRAVPSDD